MNCGPPGSSVHGIFQARVLEWGAIAFSKVLLSLPRIYPFILFLLTMPYIRTSSTHGFRCNQYAAAAAKSLQSVRPHRRQPTRLHHPWDSPGKNTGVGCHFLQCMKLKSESEVAQSCLTFIDPMDCSPPGSSVHGVFQARVLEWVAIAFSDLSARDAEN